MLMRSPQNNNTHTQDDISDLPQSEISRNVSICMRETERERAKRESRRESEERERAGEKAVRERLREKER